MKTIKKISKAILLYATMLSIILFLAGGAESLIEESQYLVCGLWFTITAAMAYLCWHLFTIEEMENLFNPPIKL